MNIIRSLSYKDKQLIEQIVHCHRVIFPNSFQNILGDRYLMKSFEWYLTNYDKRGIIVYIQNNTIIGFVTMRHSDDVDDFLIYIFSTIILSIILKPKVILNYLFFRKIFNYFKSNNSLPNEKSHLELVSIGVLPSFEKKGIGNQLLKGFEKYAKQKKNNLVILRVLKTNKKATNFYLSNGWSKKPINFSDYDLFEKNITCD